MATEADNEKGVDGTPEGQAVRWKREFKAAREKVSKWHTRGRKVVDRFLDKRDDGTDGAKSTDSRLNLFTANVQTMRCIMYGKLPRVDVSRRFADSKDDVARVSAEVLERLLNMDIQRDGDSYAEACGNALDDRLLPGAGIARIRYVAELENASPEPGDLEETPAPLEDDASMEQEEPPQRKAYECVETDYVHWRDFLWSVGRTWAQTRWVGFKSYVDRADAEKQFGEEVAKRLPFGSGKKGKGKGTEDSDDKRSPWAQVEVWEVWSKEDRKRYFYCEGYPKVLVPLGVDADEDGGVADPLGLDGFFPCPKPMFANVTSDDFLPTPDFTLAQDLYNECDLLLNRVTLLERVISVRGIYDASSAEVKQLMTEAGINEMIPVKGLKMMNDSGGLASWVQWLPIDMVVAALDKLNQQLEVKQQQLFQVTGMSDIVRGQAAQQTTATEQSIKARFASVRIQTMQDEFARFCSDLQRLKAEVIAKHFDESTLLEAANMAYTPDAQQPDVLQQAVTLIKSSHFAYRVEVKPESVSLTDYAALKSEAMEVLSTMGQYLQMAAPLGQMQPALAPMLLQLLQWTISRVRGSQEIEGVLDRAISDAQAAAQAQAQQPNQSPPPDPKLVAVQAKGAMDIRKTQMEHVSKMQQIQAQSQADLQHQAAQTRGNILEVDARERAKTLQSIDRAVSPPGTGGA
jgi:hypothetical protein